MVWRRAAELLEEQEYERVAQLLQEQQDVVRLAGQANLVILLAAVCQLCLTCRQFQADRELHQIGLDKARRRERESSRQIQAVLAMLSQLTSAQELVDLESPSRRPPTRPDEKALTAPESERQSGLLHRIWQLLGFEQTPTEPAAEPSISLDQSQATLAEQFEQLVGSTIEGIQEVEKSDAALDMPSAEEEDISEPSKDSAAQVATVKAEPALSAAPSDIQANKQPPEPSASSPGAHPREPEVPAPSHLLALRRPSATVDIAGSDAASLVVYCLGPFQTYLDERAIEKWPSGKGKSIFKYLVNNRQRPVPKEVLMDLFWPDADPDAARNNLNVAIYGLRQAFRIGDTEISHVLYQNESYLLNPKLEVWLDVDEFLERFQIAQQSEHDGFISKAVQEYHAAEALYQGEFLEEDRYEEWLLPVRRQLASHYLELLGRLSKYYFDSEEYTACITICRSMLSIDSCLEDVHCCLMRCHYRQGQHHLALRQYHRCLRALEKELEVTPAPATKELFLKIRNHKTV